MTDDGPIAFYAGYERIEVIGVGKTTAYSSFSQVGVELALADEGRTLRILINGLKVPDK